MKTLHLMLSVLLMLGFGFPNIYAQQSTGSAGGEASGSGGTASYSIGQVSYIFNQGDVNTEAQGVQQAYEISMVTSIEDAEFIQLNSSIYPNPTPAALTLDIENYPIINLSYQLFDLNGRVLFQAKLNEQKQSIDLSGLVPAVYFLRLNDHQKTIKTFRIIKK